MQIICKVCFSWRKCQIRIINQDYKKNRYLVCLPKREKYEILLNGMGGKWSCYLKTTFQEFLWLAGLEKGKYLYTKPKEKILEKLWKYRIRNLFNYHEPTGQGKETLEPLHIYTSQGEP